MATQHQVRLTVPAQPEFIRVVRVTASGLTTRLDFSIDEIDDLKVALDELCFALVGPDGSATDQQLELSYMVDGGTLTVVGQVKTDDTTRHLSLNEFSRQILPVLVDEHRLWQEDGIASFSLTKTKSAGIE